jgi:myo-inositol-1(or 4)-monophosphatase
VIPSLDELSACAVAAAERAGAVLLQRFTQPRTVEKKGLIDLVTDADRAAEEAALAVIRGRFPGHAILAEESGAHGASGVRWLLDPLDGTTNYAHGLPHFAVSVACEVDGRLEAAAILDPCKGELFTAVHGRGAKLNGRAISVSTCDTPRDALLATGFPYWITERPAELLALFGGVLPQVQGIRRFGSAALDLAWVAAGRYEGFFELGLKAWDEAAGVLLVREAGGVVTSLPGGPFTLGAGSITAAGPALHGPLVALLQAAGAKA